MADSTHPSFNSPNVRSYIVRDFGMPAYLKRPIVVQKRPLTDSIYRSFNGNHPFVYKPSFNSMSNHHVVNTEKVTLPRAANAYETSQDLRIDYPLQVEPSRYHNRDWRRRGFSGLVVCILFIGAFSLFMNIRANHQANVHAEKIAQANEALISASELSTTIPTAVSTLKPTPSDIANYQVVADLPRLLIIPKLSVNAPIYSASRNSKGSIDAPNNINDVDWYKNSALPGQSGAMLIDGHVAGLSAVGVFDGINSLVAGDSIEIERGDGAIYNYKVISNKIYPSRSITLNSVLTPVVPGSPGLNLISCTNDIIPGATMTSEQVVVYAKQVGQ